MILAPASRAAGEPAFALHTADAPDRNGPLAKVGPDWSVRLGGRSPALVKGDEVVSLRQRGRTLPPFPEGGQVILGGGERIPLAARTAVRLADEVLSLEPRPPLRPGGGAELRVPLSRVAVLWLATSSGEATRTLRRLLAERRERDQVLLHGGDVVAGTVVALDRVAGCRVKVGGAPRTVPFDRVAAVAFSTDLLVRARPRGPYGHLVLSNGCRLDLAAASVDAEAGRLLGTTVFRAAFAVPLRDVVALDLRQGRAVYLSDLTPREYSHTPFLGVSWPLVRDGSAAGSQLCLGADYYDKGVGMHAQSQVTYELAGQYQRFEATVGLDGQTGTRGRALVEVLVDGRRLTGTAPWMLAAGQRQSVDLDVRGARQLTLTVRFAGRGDVQADVDWADARLITGR